MRQQNSNIPEFITLVDESGKDLLNPDGSVMSEEKYAAHRRPALHRAVSVFIFNSSGRLLLQQRALAKYHSGGLWTNTTCGHPRPLESPLACAQRRLNQEMGISTDLLELFTFRYQAEVGDLIENEFDHVFAGLFEGDARPDPAEAMAARWQTVDKITKDLAANPARYTVWFRQCFARTISAALDRDILRSQCGDGSL